MNKLRILAHFIFGIALGGSISRIAIAADWSGFDYWAFAVVAGALGSYGAEFFQSWHYTNLYPNDKDSFQWNDVIKNFIGSLIGSALLFWVNGAFPFCLAVLGLVGIYAIIQVVRKQAI